MFTLHAVYTYDMMEYNVLWFVSGGGVVRLTLGRCKVVYGSTRSSNYDTKGVAWLVL